MAENTGAKRPLISGMVAVYFPVSGVEVFPLVPPLVGFAVAAATASAGMSGAFLLLPFQVSVLGFVSPAVSPTNLIYNIISTPGGLYRYIKEGRMSWALALVLSAGTLPGVFLGALIRIYFLAQPAAFKLFAGLVLLWLGVRLLAGAAGWRGAFFANGESALALEKKFAGLAGGQKGRKGPFGAAGLPGEARVKTRSFTLKRVEYEFWGETFSFSTPAVFLLSLAVGIIGGIYGIGGSAIIAPFCVSLLGLPVYTIAGATLAGNLVTSAAGVLFFSLLAVAGGQGPASVAAPDWALGLLFGAGGLLGTYLGAALQKYLPEKFIRTFIGVLTALLAVRYIVEYFSSWK